MDDHQKTLVKESFAKVAPRSEEAARLFYGRLFEIAPDLRALFKGDMDEQGRKLISMISVAVANIDRLDAVAPAVRALGERHATYGVTDKDYGPVAAALLWTLEQALGDAFDTPAREAWVALYTIVAGLMKDAAAERQTAAA
jgi:hemoglobin-like flavoprotein